MQRSLRTSKRTKSSRRRRSWWERRRPMQALFGSLTVLGAIVVIYPFVPLLRYDLLGSSVLSDASLESNAQLPIPGNLISQGVNATAVQQQQPTPANQEGAKPVNARNRLVIPKIGVDIPVVEGKNQGALARGAWRIPETSDTPLVGNMVVSAHRFRYRPPSSTTFYLLNKLAPSDTFLLFWNNTTYHYAVTSVSIVGPNDVGILAPSLKPQMTLFTCTPLFSTAQRLVVVGDLQLQ